jgi:hypothetical protein
MCTVTWELDGDAYRLYCNRDEKFTRATAEPPTAYVSAQTGLRFLSPRDPDGGGTWLTVNELGMRSVC